MKAKGTALFYAMKASIVAILPAQLRFFSRYAPSE